MSARRINSEGEKRKAGRPIYDPLYRCKRCGHCHSSDQDIDPAALRAARLKMRESQYSLGVRAGVSQRFISDVEQGNRRCPTWLLKFFGLSGRRSFRDIESVVLKEVEAYFKTIKAR